MPLRRATPDDIDELVRLRRVMFEAMGVDHADPGWAEQCARILRAGLATDDMAAYVVDDGGRVVAGGVGIVWQQLAGPRSPSGRRGHIQSIATDPDVRGQGHARAVMGALMGWFAERGVEGVDLHATQYGAPLYRSFGFTDPRFPALVWHPAR